MEKSAARGFRLDTIFSSISAGSLPCARGRVHGLDYPRWRVLAVLHEHSGATMGRLAELTSVDRSASWNRRG
jgi:hypothetical protein